MKSFEEKHVALVATQYTQAMHSFFVDKYPFKEGEDHWIDVAELPGEPEPIKLPFIVRWNTYEQNLRVGDQPVRVSDWIGSYKNEQLVKTNTEIVEKYDQVEG